MFTTMVHNILLFLLASIGLKFFPLLRPTEQISRKNYLYSVIPCAATTALDIGLSNSSLKVYGLMQSISLTFYTMIKSGTPVFILLFGFLFGLEKVSWKLFFIIATICSGILMMVANETSFDMVGYIQIQTATVLSGLRWALTQILLKEKAMGIHNPLATVYTLAPFIAISLFFCFLIWEGPQSLMASPLLQDTSKLFPLSLAVIGGGCLAFVMIILEFLIITKTSVLTFSIAGIFKEIITISTSHFIFHDSFTFMMGVGLVISLIGIGLYHTVRVTSQEPEFRELNDTELEAWDVEWDE